MKKIVFSVEVNIHDDRETVALGQVHIRARGYEPFRGGECVSSHATINVSSIDYGSDGAYADLFLQAIHRTVRNTVDLFVSRKILRNAVFALFALDHADGHSVEEVDRGMQDLWQAADLDTRKAYRLKCQQLLAWLEKTP